MQVLKDLISYESEDGENSPSHLDPERSKVKHAGQAQHQLLCIITAFELLSGQGMSNLDVP
jgi:nucleolar complex protein 3